jgi:aryl-alcohol dehydrogenase-like predicted oxidoreductase
MNKRRLGNSGLEIAPLAFGGNVFGWTIDETTSFQLLDGFVEAGFDFIDTADLYSIWKPGNKGGESETIIGKWMKERGNRHQVLIATKLGFEIGPGKKGLSRQYMFSAVEDSLERLQTDYIDLYQAHKDDTETPLAETLAAFAELIEQGKVRAIGASNYTADRLGEALQISESQGLPRYQTLQPLYNLYDREPFEKELEPLCMKENIGVIPYYALASGFLTGKYRSEADKSKSARGEGTLKYLDDRGRRILNALDQVAAEKNSTAARVAIAWLLARPSIAAPIASATSLEQLKDLVQGAKLDLDHSSMELLNQASAWEPQM